MRYTITTKDGSVLCADCGAEDCDVCHIHDQPCDEDGFCDECNDERDVDDILEDE